jgi:hypothetical protein
MRPAKQYLLNEIVTGKAESLKSMHGIFIDDISEVMDKFATEAISVMVKNLNKGYAVQLKNKSYQIDGNKIIISEKQV